MSPSYPPGHKEMGNNKSKCDKIFLSLNPTNQIPRACLPITHFSTQGPAPHSACLRTRPCIGGNSCHPAGGSLVTPGRYPCPSTSVLCTLAIPLGPQSGSPLLAKGTIHFSLRSHLGRFHTLDFLTTPQCFHPFNVICISNIKMLKILIIIITM